MLFGYILFMFKSYFLLNVYYLTVFNFYVFLKSLIQVPGADEDHEMQLKVQKKACKWTLS